MEIILTIGFWIIVFAFMVILNPVVISMAGLPFTALSAICIKIFGKGFESTGMFLTGAGGAFIAFFFIYSFAWNYFFSTSIPILFYIASLVGAWFGSGGDVIEANKGNKLMMMGEVPVVIVLLIMAVMGGASLI